MPVKRRLAKVRDNRITLEAIAAFQTDDRDGLHRALGSRPWDHSPLDIDSGDERPAWVQPEAWAKAVELRQMLKEATDGR